MDPREPSTVFAAAIAVGLVVVAVAVVSRPIRRPVARAAPALVAVVAMSATAGSLYYSEVAGYLPCTLCWYQRIAMYPMAVVVPLGLVVGDRSVLRSSLVLASLGAVLSGYHVQLQLFPAQDSNSCELTNPCTARWVEAFGFITIPQMAGGAFVMIIGLSVLGLRRPDAAGEAVAADLDTATDADERHVDVTLSGQ